MRERLLEVIEKHWGYSSFRPLQEDAMTAVLDGRDSVVVMPTGGGKSLCYQAPALLREGVTVVVSPLISLMKDQVDALIACGVPAAQMNSSQSSLEHRALAKDLEDGKIRLLFVSPERLAMPRFRESLREAGVAGFAIDEAHCISHWGHDFRPEYRQLRTVREEFPDAAFHAYTATATEQVRRDIAQQLALREPKVLVGDFDRPNLVYRVLPRVDELKQLVEVLERHRGEAGIVYCIRRRDVDDLSAQLRKRGYDALAYHAGLSQEERRATQEAFAAERCDVVVATVAFGMGIDRSNVRFVVHMAMPKSIEHYQQETGRAGRDGLEAECILFYSGADIMLWKTMLADSQHPQAAGRHLYEIDRYCSGTTCRHRALVEYFGQSFSANDSCNACDVCLGEMQDVPDALTVAQKIISCVYRLRSSFGVGHVISVLRGENIERVRERQHDQLSTYGIMREHSRNELRDLIYQLVNQGYLQQTGDEYPVLQLSESSREALRGEVQIRLRQPVVPKRKEARPRRSVIDEAAVYDRDLFEELRKWRRGEAERRGVPPYVIFSDRTLREVARLQPLTLTQLRGVYGVGDAKLEQFGDAIVTQVARFSGERTAPARGT